MTTDQPASDAAAAESDPPGFIAASLPATDPDRRLLDPLIRALGYAETALIEINVAATRTNKRRTTVEDPRHEALHTRLQHLYAEGLAYTASIRHAIRATGGTDA